MQGRSVDQLDQRLDRLISRGRDVVEGVAGARPGSRAAANTDTRQGERRNGWRNDLNGLGRWVENRLDRLLDEGESDWREPWQEDGRPAEIPSREANTFQSSTSPARLAPGRPDSPRSIGEARSIGEGRASGRRPLDAISRRGLGTRDASTAKAAHPRRASQEPAALMPPPADPSPGQVNQAEDSWPDEALFSVPRWSRPIGSASTAEGTAPAAEASAPLRKGDRQPDAEMDFSPRPLPRSSRRRSP